MTTPEPWAQDRPRSTQLPTPALPTPALPTDDGQLPDDCCAGPTAANADLGWLCAAPTRQDTVSSFSLAWICPGTSVCLVSSVLSEQVNHRRRHLTGRSDAIDVGRSCLSVQERSLQGGH